MVLPAGIALHASVARQRPSRVVAPAAVHVSVAAAVPPESDTLVGDMVAMTSPMLPTVTVIVACPVSPVPLVTVKAAAIVPVAV